jgi:hypothetical protein
MPTPMFRQRICNRAIVDELNAHSTAFDFG